MSIQEALNQLHGGVGRVSSTLHGLQSRYDDAVDAGSSIDPDVLVAIRRRCYDLRQLLQKSVEFSLKLERSVEERERRQRIKGST